MNKILLITILLLGLNAGESFSQRGNNNNFSDEIGKAMKQKLMESVNLDEATANKFVELRKEKMKQMRDLMREKRDLMKQINDNPDAADIESKLNNILDLETKAIEVRRNHINEMKLFMTPQQIAKSMIFIKKFNKEFRNQIKQKGNRQMKNNFDK